jgi:hypothetical protein
MKLKILAIALILLAITGCGGSGGTTTAPVNGPGCFPASHSCSD